MASVFSRIISGEIPSFKILESDLFYSFLDIRPINPGHTLVVPKIEIDRFFDLPQVYLSQILPFASKVSLAIEKSVPCKRVGLIVAGLEIPHAHLHLVPIIDEGDLTFERAKPANREDLKSLQIEIKKHLQ